MRTVAENLEILYNSVQNIKQAITEKGGDVSGDISTWSESIRNVGSSDGPGSVLKISNKLNGQLFGGPSYLSSGEILHVYEFEGGEPSSLMLIPINSYSMQNEIFPSPISPGISLQSNYSTSLTQGDNNMTIRVHPGACRCGQLNCGVTEKYEIFFYCSGNPEQVYNPAPLEICLVVFDEDHNYDIDFFKVQGGGPCFVKNTKITLSDYTTKHVEEITYNDELLVWNFDEGKLDKAKPLWIKKVQTEEYYYKVTLSDGNIFNCTGPNGHRMFNVTKQSFEYPMNCINDEVYTLNGIVTVLSCDKIIETVEYYNIITEYHINLFADDVLTSCRYNNLYPIEDMKFIKDDRLQRAPKWKLYESFRDYRCLDRYIEGLRLYEQINIPIEETIKYCERLESLRKKIDEFDDNKVIIKDIENTEVGWIDREGNSYGFKIYMQGQCNHIILADKICKELNVETENPSRYLEKEGWLKYTTEFVLNSNDKEINDNQLNALRKFLKTPNKLKKEGKIKIGDIMSNYVNISEFDTMDKYSFEYRKKHGRNSTL